MPACAIAAPRRGLWVRRGGSSAGAGRHEDRCAVERRRDRRRDRAYFNLEAAGAREPDRLLGQIIARVAQGRSKISVLDWRGGVGQGYFAAKASAPDVELDWHVFEEPAYCDYGKALDAPVRFHEISALRERPRYDLVLVRGTLGLDPDWRRSFLDLSRAAEHALALAPVFVHQASTFVARTIRPNGAAARASTPGSSASRICKRRPMMPA